MTWGHLSQGWISPACTVFEISFRRYPCENEVCTFGGCQYFFFSRGLKNLRTYLIFETGLTCFIYLFIYLSAYLTQTQAFNESKEHFSLQESTSVENGILQVQALYDFTPGESQMLIFFFKIIIASHAESVRFIPSSVTHRVSC